jgi:NAD(P)H-hydrate epimerase
MNTIPRLPMDAAENLPWLTAEQMAEVDRAMVEDLGILLLQMMELAGSHLAQLARERFLGGDARARSVVVLSGTGGNGGGALTCARRLAAWGAKVSVQLSERREAFVKVPGHQLGILEEMGLPIHHDADALPEAPPMLIIDGIIGYSLRGNPRGASAELIRWANAMPAPVLSLDVPSGLDATTGAASDPTIEAAATMTLALPKCGLREEPTCRLAGELYLADIGVPPQLYARPPLGLAIPEVFARCDLLRLR